MANAQHNPERCNDCSCSSTAIKRLGGCPWRVRHRDPAESMLDSLDDAEGDAWPTGGEIVGALLAVLVVAIALGLVWAVVVFGPQLVRYVGGRL